MELTIDKEQMMRYKALFVRHMSDPVKLRLATAGGLLLLFVILVYMPFSEKIDENRRLLAEEETRNRCLVDCARLQRQSDAFKSLVDEKHDTNEWTNYLLDGLGKYQVKLRGMTSRQQQEVGPYGVASFSMEIEGEYSELRNYVEWVESSPRLIRIDSLQLEQRPKDLLKMKIVILGVINKK